MRRSAAKARLRRMVAWNQDPTLTDADLEDLLDLARASDADGNAPLVAGDEWEAATAYALGAVVVPPYPNGNGHTYAVTTAGTSGATAPTFPLTTGGTVTSGTVVFTERGADGLTDWRPTYNLGLAAAEGWRWKKAMVANRVDITSDGQTVSRSQYLAHCDAMIASFAGIFAVSVASGA